jgi:hypothetical protein
MVIIIIIIIIIIFNSISIIQRISRQGISNVFSYRMCSLFTHPAHVSGM